MLAQLSYRVQYIAPAPRLPPPEAHAARRHPFPVSVEKLHVPVLCQNSALLK